MIKLSSLLKEDNNYPSDAPEHFGSGKNIDIFGYKNTDLGQFSLCNIELLIKKNLVQKNLIKPLYIS